MAKEIIVPYGAITKIAKEVNKSKNTVSLALKGATKSELAEYIRKVAKKYGGR
jgi:DNA-binding LacI/PurR family transcriptional regulator